MNSLFSFSERRNASAFWIGSLVVSAGVVLHLPMFWMGRNSGFNLSHMPMDAGMLWGMALIVFGILAAGYGLLPKTPPSVGLHEILAPSEDAALSAAHWKLMAVLAVALIIDVMKPASLGFVTPGMRIEYGIDRATVALLPLSALIGTAAGSFIWGALADMYGRRASILLSSVMFVGTSICGAMPSFWWNVGMCFLMGAAAGGMLPIAYALLAEIMPTKHRGWSLVLIGGLGTIGGYFAASELSALLQPFFGWRIMWFLNLPTGLLLIGLSPLIPESARFLQQMGRIDEARAILARFGAMMVLDSEEEPDTAKRRETRLPLASQGRMATTVALTLGALAWGLVNFGVLLWLPSSLVAEGRSVGLASGIIARSILIAAPTVLVAAYLYNSWSTKYSLLTAMTIMALGLAAVLLRAHGTIVLLSNPIVSLALLIVGSSAVISILLPYAAENYPVKVRGRATGWVAGWSKIGGLIAQGLSVLALVPALGIAAAIVAVPAVAALVLIGVSGRETRGRDLRELESGQIG
ncbi:MAG TPA: MFS transporter [Steroidobacteraceae bacterium]|jgi:putative MFS transporter|nr:MFS transporter [Steroidobacteraceae bacterium]